jgi:hypothetical protein
MIHARDQQSAEMSDSPDWPRLQPWTLPSSDSDPGMIAVSFVAIPLTDVEPWSGTESSPGDEDPELNGRTSESCELNVSERT